MGLSIFTDFHNLIRRDGLGVRLGCNGHAGRAHGSARHWRAAGRAPSRGGLMKWSAVQEWEEQSP